MTLTGAAAAASLALAAAVASAPVVATTAAHSSVTTAAKECAGVTVVVEYAELDGPDTVACATGGGTAAELFDEAGLDLEYRAGMQDFVCTVDGLPQDRDCTASDAYWSLWWSDGSTGWSYATLGVSSLEVPQGGALAFTWHQGEGRAEEPASDVGATEVPSAAVTAGSGEAEPTTDDGSPVTRWIAVGLAVLVLGVAAAVPILRRRAE